MKRILFLFFKLFFLFSSTHIHAQKNDYIWILGYGGGSQSPPTDEFGGVILQFTDGQTLQIIERQDIASNMDGTNALIADSLGNLIAYSNGEKIFNKNYQLMDNGGGITLNWDGWGYRLPQGAIGVPMVNNDSLSILLNTEFKNLGNTYSGFNLFKNTIDTRFNNTDGKVIEKRKIIISDTISFGQLTSTKHANGRDWWVTAPKRDSKKYYQILLTESGVSSIDTIITDTIYTDGVGMAKYTPDGTKYIRATSRTIGGPSRIDIFDFDRCTGHLFNRRTHYIPLAEYGNGVEISSNSRYLYIIRTNEIYQYDLLAPDIFATETIVAEFDGFVSYFSAANFFLAQAGPDGRIYVTGTNSVFHMHYINFPNRAGAACQVVQHGIELPTLNITSLPNLPNFRLGPLDDSACDTLGLDNHPLARFRWDFEDTLSPLRVTFSDLSAYLPDTWHWDFGDGTTYDTTATGEVVHTFPAPGLYTVCLSVSNTYSADSVCFNIQIGTSNTDEAPALQPAEVRIYPNPVRHLLSVHTPGTPEWERVDATLHDALGRPVFHTAWRGSVGQMQVGDLPQGVYWLELQAPNRRFQTLKVLKQ